MSFRFVCVRQDLRQLLQRSYYHILRFCFLRQLAPVIVVSEGRSDNRNSIALVSWIQQWPWIWNPYGDSPDESVPFSGTTLDSVQKAFVTVLVWSITWFCIFHPVTHHLLMLITTMSSICSENSYEIIDYAPLFTVIAIAWLNTCATIYLTLILIHTLQLHTVWCIDKLLNES
jgi:hypothetical protein